MRRLRLLAASLVVFSAACVGPGEGSAARELTSTTATTLTTLDVDQPTTQTTTTSAPTTITAPPAEPVSFDSLAGINTIPDFSGYTDSGLARWQRSVPGIEDRRVTSTADGSEQPVLWLAPSGDRDRPLLVILHSWSSAYDQHAGIPYAMWAAENGWAVVAPNFRGVNDDAEAIGSDLAVQDVVDAIDFATAQDLVDADRVYAVGYSGGGMMALLVAGRHPDRVDAVAAWGPPADLTAFYRNSLRRGARYVRDIEAGCGGDPTTNEAAREECIDRSPSTYISAARDNGVAVFLGQGIRDTLVRPSQSAITFNQLANPVDRFRDDELEAIAHGDLPADLEGSITTETYLAAGDPAPVFARASGPALLVYFAGGHDMVYGATVRWFADDPS